MSRSDQSALLLVLISLLIGFLVAPVMAGVQERRCVTELTIKPLGPYNSYVKQERVCPRDYLSRLSR